MINEKILELRAMLMAEANLVEKMVSLAMDGLFRNQSSYEKEVLTYEKRVNQIEVDIDSKCIAMIALHQPEAKDLREILMIYRINNDLERLGDQAVNISESATHLIGEPILEALPELPKMAKATLRMLKMSIEAFGKEDVESSRQVCSEDEIVDDYNRLIYEQLLLLMKDKPENIKPCLHVLRIAKNLERIGDLSTNIAENNIYMAEGKVIKHHQDE